MKEILKKNKKNANKIKEMLVKLLYNSSSSNVEFLEETMVQLEKQLKLKKTIVMNHLRKSPMMIIIESAFKINKRFMLV